MLDNRSSTIVPVANGRVVVNGKHQAMWSQNVRSAASAMRMFKGQSGYFVAAPHPTVAFSADMLAALGYVGIYRYAA